MRPDLVSGKKHRLVKINEDVSVEEASQPAPPVITRCFVNNYTTRINSVSTVEAVTSEFCRQHDELPVDSDNGLQSGNIASIMTSDIDGCDGSHHPWVIRALPGQRINLTLYDFSSSNSGGGNELQQKMLSTHHRLQSSTNSIISAWFVLFLVDEPIK